MGGVTVDQGQGGDPGQTYWPENYPTDPYGRPRITVTPKGTSPQGKEIDPWADYGAKAPPQAAPAAGAAAPDPWDSHGAKAPPPPPPRQDIGAGEAGVAGLTNVFGAGPAVAGLAEASGIERPNIEEEVDPAEAAKRAGIYVSRPFVGLAKIAHQYITGSGDQTTIDAYNRGRQADLDYNDQAFKRHPTAYLLGQLAQAVALPLSGAGAAAKGAGAATRVLGGARAGAVGGAAYGAGEGVSEGKSPADIGIDTGLGAATGAVTGGALQGVVEGGAKTFQRVGQVLRGAKDPQQEAERRLTDAFTADRSSAATPSMTPGQSAVARATGLPVKVADVGGPKVQALADWAATNSPEAKWRIGQFAQRRFWGQNSRMANLLRGITPKPVDIDKLQAAARKVTKPLYDRAYLRGAGGLWNAELERLTGSPDVQDAMQRAVRNGKAWAVRDGYGGFNPGVTFQNGLMSFRKGASGQPSYPDLRFWDYVHREMASEIDKAVRAGDKQTAARLIGQHNQLLGELDRLVPEFKVARGAHSAFKRGERALESGQDFVGSNEMSVAEGRKYLASLSPAERELFTIGFAQSLIDKLEGTRDRISIFNQINASPQARQKLELALGRNRANIVEAGLRAEEIVDRLRAAGGNSATAGRLNEGAKAGSFVGGVEAFKEAGFSPTAMLASILGFSALRKHAAEVDEKVATHLADMLLSDDPTKFVQAAKRIGASPVLLEAIRRFGEAGSRTAIGNIGPRNVTAGAAAYITHEHPEHHHQPNEDLIPGPGPVQ